MRRLLVLPLFVLGTVCATRAQETLPGTTKPSRNVAADFAVASAGNATFALHPAMDAFSAAPGLPAAPAVAIPWASAEPNASPAPAPEPRFVYGGRDDYRWQLGFGASWYRFRSSIFNASAIGVKTSLTYFTNEWFGIEGNVTATFAPRIYANEHVKLLIYGAGPKIAWRQRRWEPWMHVIVGGGHEIPATAGNSKSTFAIEAGGGADYRWNPRISFRVEGNLVRTGFFKQSQNNFEIMGGLVFHF